MRKSLLTAMLLMISLASFAQIEDNFDSNIFSWNETSSKRGVALVKDGVLHMESKGEKLMCVTYLPVDIMKPFVLSCEALAKKLSGDKTFGIIIDYVDEKNYMCFYMNEDEALLEVYREGILKGNKYARHNFQSGKNLSFVFEVEYKLNELVFKVNNITIMAYRSPLGVHGCMLDTSGFGFFAKDGMVIDFDNLKVTQ